MGKVKKELKAAQEALGQAIAIQEMRAQRTRDDLYDTVDRNKTAPVEHLNDIVQDTLGDVIKGARRVNELRNIRHTLENLMGNERFDDDEDDRDQE